MLNRFAENWTNFFAESIAICTKIVYIIMGGKLRIYSAFRFLHNSLCCKFYSRRAVFGLRKRPG